MDFLNNAVSQARDLFKSMTPAARLTAAMLLVMIVVSLVYLVSFSAGTANRYLYGGREFSDSEMDTIQNAFAAANLDKYELDGRRIRVPGSRISEYVQALNKAGFTPSDIEAPIDQVIADSGDLFRSKDEKEFQRSQAQQQKLSRTISMRPQVDRATVQYREVKDGGFPAHTDRQATVVVCGNNNQPLSRGELKTIRGMAASWFNIDLEDVAVSDVNGGIEDELTSSDGMSKEARMYAETKAIYEERWKRKIHECLSFIPGIIPAVNVELEPIITNESTKVKVDPKPVAVQSESFSKSSESRPSPGGRPGAVPNEVPGNQPRNISSMASQETTEDESRENQVSVAGHEQQRQRMAPLTPKLVTASISIPRSYFDKIWHQRNPTAAGEEIPAPSPQDLTNIETEVTQQVEEKVATVTRLLAAGQATPNQEIEVSSYDDLKMPEPAGPSIISSTGAWFSNNWQTLGLFGIGALSLFFLRSMIRSATPHQESAGQAEAETPEEPQEEQAAEEEPTISLPQRSGPASNSLRDELTAMVREDPDAAANVLRTWIGDAA